MPICVSSSPRLHKRTTELSVLIVRDSIFSTPEEEGDCASSLGRQSAGPHLESIRSAGDVKAGWPHRSLLELRVLCGFLPHHGDRLLQ